MRLWGEGYKAHLMTVASAMLNANMMASILSNRRRAFLEDFMQNE